MPRVVFGSQLMRHLQGAPSDSVEVQGETVGEALRQAFSQVPGVEGYVVDEHGRVRKHVAVFIDGEALADRTRLDGSVRPSTEIYVLQALSGG